MTAAGVFVATADLLAREFIDAAKMTVRVQPAIAHVGLPLTGLQIDIIPLHQRADVGASGLNAALAKDRRLDNDEGQQNGWGPFENGIRWNQGCSHSSDLVVGLTLAKNGRK